eukprot:gene17452-biopygen18885
MTGAGASAAICHQGEQDTGASVARAIGYNLAQVARAWRGHGTGMSCSPRGGRRRCDGPAAHHSPAARDSPLPVLFLFLPKLILQLLGFPLFPSEFFLLEGNSSGRRPGAPLRNTRFDTDFCWHREP